MTHIYDRNKTFNYFETLAVTYDSYADDTNLHVRDRLLLERILPSLGARKLRILDYGCGGGHLLVALAKHGHDVLGIEPGSKLQEFASEKLQQLGLPGDSVKLGGLDALQKIESHSLDMVVAMGVFQYLSESEYATALTEMNRVLKHDGHLVCTFQNSLFDLFTFNKFTVDFLEQQIFSPLAPLGLKVDAAVEQVKTLMVNPDLPKHSETRARDNIFVRLTNPLTLPEELQQFGFSIQKRHFYAFHAVPPLISKAVGADKVSELLEIEHSEDWQGHFTGSAFLVHCKSSSRN